MLYRSIVAAIQSPVNIKFIFMFLTNW